MPHPATSEPATPQTRRKPRRVWRTFLVTLVGAVTITMLVLRLQPPPPPFELITANEYESRTKRLAFVRDARVWMTRFSPKVFGFAPVQISAVYVTGRNSTSGLSQLPEPGFSTNVVRVWILKSNEVVRAEGNLLAENTARWRLTTSEGIPSVLSTGSPTGTGPGSVEFANHPKIRGGNVDLAAKLTAPTERVTNQIAFRMSLKRDEGGIVFDGNGVLFIWAHAPPKR